MKKIFLALTLSFVSLPVAPVMADSSAVGDISEELICQCGCTLTVSNCTHIECGSRGAMTALIELKLAKGQSSEQVIQFFVDQYGEQVLSSPPKRGFNLVAWLLPFAAILAGGGVISIALKRWVWRGRQSPIMATAEAGEQDEEYQHRLEEELAEFTGKGFR
jgi:cytochrome c-type biogenesis protein CcmH